jgi:hypothetical protein
MTGGRARASAIQTRADDRVPDAREPQARAAAPSRGARAGSLPVSLTPATLFRWLTIVIAVLVAASLAGTISRLFLGHDNLRGLIPLFNVDAEANVPTWFSAAMLLFAALLLAIIWRAESARDGRFARHWGALAVIFAYLSADEGGHIHEVISTPLPVGEFMQNFGGITWLALNGLGLVILCVAYRRFVFALPSDVLRLALASGLVFITGAVGVELATWISRRTDPNSVAVEFMPLFEESLEMLGAAIFIYALLLYIARHLPPLVLTAGDAPRSSPE